MAGPARNAGYADYSSSGASKFIPEIWSSKLVPNLYAATVFGEICNTDYEGEIKAFGDNVIIRGIPAIAIADYVIGAGLTYAKPEKANTNLPINKAKSFSYAISSVDKTQSDLNLLEAWSKDASSRMKIAMDTDILGAIYASAHAANAGAAAGVISANINLGTTGTPLSFTKANATELIVDYMQVLTEQNAPEEGRFVVLPAGACSRIKKSDLKDASITGDGVSVMRNGRIGMIDNCTVYSSNNVSVATGKYNVIFGHRMATTFASQIVEMETLKNPDDFGDLIRGLNVYGYKVIKPEALGHSVITLG